MKTEFYHSKSQGLIKISDMNTAHLDRAIQKLKRDYSGKKMIKKISDELESLIEAYELRDDKLSDAERIDGKKLPKVDLWNFDGNKKHNIDRF